MYEFYNAVCFEVYFGMEWFSTFLSSENKSNTPVLHWVAINRGEGAAVNELSGRHHN